MKSSTRIDLAFTLGLSLGIPISFLNRRDLFLSLQAGFIFAVIVAALVAMLSWGMEIAVKKGYPAWVGFLLVLFLNVCGLLLLVILPSRLGMTDQVSQ